jgi:hypothetical protein
VRAPNGKMVKILQSMKRAEVFFNNDYRGITLLSSYYS